MSESLFMKLTDEPVKEIDRLIMEQIKSPVELLNQACFHLITAGGKRIRPRLMALITGLISPDAVRNMDILSMGAAVEILHTATLMHDDVIDEGLMRRGIPSTNSAYGNKVAVLGGDYLFTKAYNATIRATDARISRVFSDALTTLVQGELTQMTNTANLEITEESYFRTIYSKTAVLFEITTKIPGLILNRTEEEIEALAKYGRNIGYAFQIADDILDYTSDSEVLGKVVGKDMDEKKITLPLIYALNNDKGICRETIYEAINGGRVEEILQIIADTDAVASCDTVAERLIGEAIDAIAVFKESEYMQALRELAYAAYRRRY